MEPPPDCSSCYVKEDDKIIPAERVLENNGERDREIAEEFLDAGAGVGPLSIKDGQSISARLSKTSDDTRSIRSSAAIAYSATKNNTAFSRLAPMTDLNLAPANWLRKTVGIRPEALFSGGRYAVNPQTSFGAFAMASSHLDCVGNVDVVSDAENIKRLLKMPYSKGHVSMAIHRIGRTLLLEDFDIKRYTAEESEWQWFRSFYQELVQQQGSNKIFKKKCASSQYERLMLSKFLYYSIRGEKYDNLENKLESSEYGSKNRISEGAEKNAESNVKLVEIDEKSETEIAGVCPTTLLPQWKDTDGNSGPLVTAEKRWRYWTPNESFSSQVPPEEFERNILWTFEDLQMMLGTNMPIFGGGKYPAVSLRLRNSNKPINILTGIDYWLDNLICNVPEVVMCFHVDGIVQDYEVIKTEEIPKLEHSSFSPQVVKDIAQNILSFLKSNCTKEGHTYWLFKGSGDDVVKLYDLTILCNSSDEMPSSKSTQNPYVFSVAMLLYKTAISLMQTTDTCDHRITVKKLLEHCIDLLDHSKYQNIICSAICILSTLSLPDPGLDQPTKDSSQSVKENDSNSSSVDWKTCDTCAAHYDADLADARRNSEGASNTEIASIPRVTDLSIPERYQSVPASFDLIRSPPTRAPRRNRSNLTDQAGQVEESCHIALSYIVSGFEALMRNTKHEWRDDLRRQLARNAALVYFRLAERASELGELGRALRRTRLALQSYETYDFLCSGRPVRCEIDPEPQRMIPPDFHLLLPRLLSLCGELQFAVVQDIRSHGAVSSPHREEFGSFTDEDEKVRNALRSVWPGCFVEKYDCLTILTSELDNALQACARSYEAALDVMKKRHGMKYSTESTTKSGGRELRQKSRVKTKKALETQQQTPPSVTNIPRSDVVAQLQTTLIRRHGHVNNELGASVLHRAVGFLSDLPPQDPTNPNVQNTCDEANTYFEVAYDSFTQVDDFINQALVLSNMGRLMRVYAQFYSNQETGLLSKQERRCFTLSIEKYQKALALLEAKDCGEETCKTVYDNISWELSTAYYTMAQILQENAPLERRASEEAEKEVITLMNHSLKYCKDLWDKTPKQSIALYRQAKIHYRIASLHHNSYRRCVDVHKCKQLRTLAETHYEKSIKLFEGLEHPNELLRSQLERLALKEQHIASLNTVNQKLKLLFEGIHAICDCSKVLELVQKYFKLATTCSQVDAVDRPDPSGSEMDSTNAEEIARLLRILVTILESFLLSLVRLTSVARENLEQTDSKKGKIRPDLHPQIYKDLYSRTLRKLQPVKTNEIANDLGVEETTFEKLRGDLPLVLGVLADVSTSGHF